MEKETYKNSREARYHEKINKKKKRVINLIIAIGVVAVIGLITFGIVYSVVQRAEPGNDYSVGLSENGFIADFDVASSIKLCDYKNIAAPSADVEVTDEKLQTEIDGMLDKHDKLNNDLTLVAASGDKVNIDFVGTIDGVEFTGGNTNGAGSDVTLGSGSLIDDFEDQIVGHKPGDAFTVDVTFPDEYSNNPDVAGKDASFAVTLNGIYGDWELTDEFVETYYPSYGTDTDEFKAYVKNEMLTENLKSYLVTYLNKECKVKKYPSTYVKGLKSTLYYEDEQMFNYYNQLYSYYNYDQITSIYAYAGVTSAAAYDRQLNTRAKSIAKSMMIMQAVYEECGLAMTDNDVVESVIAMGYNADQYDTAVTNYSINYIKQYTMVEMVAEYLLDYITIE